MKIFGPIALFLILFGVVGCSGGGTQSMNQDYLQNAEAQGKAKRAIFDRAGGDWNAMSAEDKKEFLSYFPDEANAQKFWEMMKHPPSSGGPGIPPTGAGTGAPTTGN
ncbi:MAG: hypothetical protein HZC36_16210 [Armatimonadetes bacterium]|nr:hypothetical protein [Armatimonadota bacterium]